MNANKLIQTLAMVVAGTGTATATPVLFDVQTGDDGTHVSGLHSADGCLGGPDGDLYLCSADLASSFEYRITAGTLTGDYSNGVIKRISGALYTSSTDPRFAELEITNGRLGGNGAWFLDYALDGFKGRFWFDSALGSGTDGPNAVSSDSLLLWGQNKDAYLQSTGAGHSAIGDDLFPIGIDLYAAIYSEPPTSVPEPATWLLIGAGLGALAWQRRRTLRHVD